MTYMTSERKILITGASGFVGRALGAALVRNQWLVTGLARAESISRLPDRVVPMVWPVTDTSWAPNLDEFEAVVHLAARVHTVNDTTDDQVHLYRAINAEATARLALAASHAGVRRFIYVSSIKVNGEKTQPGRFFKETDEPAPQGAYAQSKWEAERLLAEIAYESSLEVVILRPPLVYGPEVRANFLQMMRAIDKRIPLPLAEINNKRSMLFIHNFVSVIECCITHPAAVGQTFLLSDGQDVSTPVLITGLARAMGRTPHLFKVPIGLLRGLTRLLGKSEAAGRLLDSLLVDSSKIREALGWQPPVGLQQGLAHTAEWYLRSRLHDR